MKRLTVLYDSNCAFCRRCVTWLQAQPQYLELEFIPADSPFAAKRFPELSNTPLQAELTVVDDEGGVYVGESAYVMCLYALRDYRAWSIRLGDPANRPFVRKALNAVTRNRRTLSELFTS